MRNALIAAVVAALVSSAAGVAATGYISGARIKPHTIAASRLTSGAVTALAARPALITATGSVPNTMPGVDGSIPVTTIVAQCPAGDSAVAGGYRMTNLATQAGFVLYTNGPTADGTGWEIDVVQRNPGDASDTPAFAVTAGCVAVGP